MKHIKKPVSMLLTVAILLCGMFVFEPADMRISALEADDSVGEILSGRDFPTKTVTNSVWNNIDGMLIDTTSLAAGTYASFISNKKVNASQNFSVEAEVTLYGGVSNDSYIGIAFQKTPGSLSAGNGGWAWFRWQQTSTTAYYGLHDHVAGSQLNRAFYHQDNTTDFGDTHRLRIDFTQESGVTVLRGYVDGNLFVVNYTSNPPDMGMSAFPDSAFTGEWYLGIMTRGKTRGVVNDLHVTKYDGGQETFTVSHSDLTAYITPNTTCEPIGPGAESLNPTSGNCAALSPITVNAQTHFIFEADVTINSGASWAGIVLTRKPDALGGSGGGWYNLRWYVDTGYIRFVNYYPQSSIYNQNKDYRDFSANEVGQTHNLRIEFNEGVFHIWYDGKLTGSYADSGFTGNWYLGLITNNVTARFDRISYAVLYGTASNPFTYNGFSVRVESPLGMRAKYTITREVTDNQQGWRVSEYGALVTQRETFDQLQNQTDAPLTLGHGESTLPGTDRRPIWRDGQYLGSIYDMTSGSIVFTAVLYDIQTINLAMEYVFRAYCIIEFDSGYRVTVYDAMRERSMYDLVTQVLADPDNGLLQPNEEYLENVVITPVDAYASVADYKLVISAQAGVREEQAADELERWLTLHMRITPTRRTDAVSGGKEIVIGDTTRTQSQAVLGTLGHGDYAIQTYPNMIVAVGGTPAATINAVRKLTEVMREYTPDELIAQQYSYTYELPAEYTHPLVLDSSSFQPVWKDIYTPPAWMHNFDEKLYAVTLPGTGGRLLSSSHRADQYYYPEGSLESILSAVLAGADYIEMDLRYTADNILVLMHDNNLRRTTDWEEKAGKDGLPQSPYVSDWTYEQLLALRLKMHDGTQTDYRIPMFVDAVAICAGRSFIDVDDKVGNLDYVKDIFPLADDVGSMGKASFLRKFSDLLMTDTLIAAWIAQNPADTVFTTWAQTYQGYLALPGHSRVLRYYPNTDGSDIWYEDPQTWAACFAMGKTFLFTNEVVKFCKYIAQNHSPTK